MVVLIKFTPFGPILETGAIANELGIDKVVLDSTMTGCTPAHLVPMTTFLFQNTRAEDVSLLLSKLSI